MNKWLPRTAIFLALVCCLASDGLAPALAQDNYPKASRRKPSKTVTKPITSAAPASVGTFDSAEAEAGGDEELEKAKQRQAEYERLQKQEAEFNSWKQQNEINEKNRAKNEYKNRVSDRIIMQKDSLSGWEGLYECGYAKMQTAGKTASLLQEHESQYNDIKRLLKNYQKGLEPDFRYPDIQASEADQKTYRELLKKEIRVRTAIVQAYERELDKRGNSNYSPVDKLFK